MFYLLPLTIYFGKMKTFNVPVKQSVEYLLLLGKSEPIVGAVNYFTLIAQVGTDLIKGFRIVEDVSEYVNVAR